MPEAPPPTIFERSVAGRRAGRLPALDVPEPALEALVPAELLRAEPPGLPEVSEPELVRHFTALSRRNFGVDRVNAAAAAFSESHPEPPGLFDLGDVPDDVVRNSAYACALPGS